MLNPLSTTNRTNVRRPPTNDARIKASGATTVLFGTSCLLPRNASYWRRISPFISAAAPWIFLSPSSNVMASLYGKLVHGLTNQLTHPERMLTTAVDEASFKGV